MTPQSRKRPPGWPKRPSVKYRMRKTVPVPQSATKKSGWDIASVFVQGVGALAVFVSLGALAVSVWQFNQQQRSVAAQTLNQQRQDALNEYFSDMSTLALQDNLTKSKPGDPVRAIAEARTYTTVRDLDGERKGTLIRYLREASLITGSDPVLSLQKADLDGIYLPSGAILNEANLSNLSIKDASLSGVQLHGVDLRGSVLIGDNLSGAQLTCLPPIRGHNGACVNLNGADLDSVNLSGADLTGAQLACLPKGSTSVVGLCTQLSSVDLSDAYLDDAKLSGANLAGADLAGAQLTGANLRGADLRGTTYNTRLRRTTNALRESLTENPTQWPRGFDPQAAGAVCVDC